MADVQIFEHEQFGKVRVVVINGITYFVGKDVALALGYGNYRQALKTNVDAEDKVLHSVDTLGGKQKMTVINESGLYSLILLSKLPTAKEFKRWVTSEVLPAIRETGIYSLETVLYKLKNSSEQIAEIFCCVYILEMENDTVKIGYTKNFSSHAKTVSNSSGLKIVNWCHSEYVLAETAKKIERRCHSTFAESKTLGEFFKSSFDDAKNELSRHLNISETMYID